MKTLAIRILGIFMFTTPLWILVFADPHGTDGGFRWQHGVMILWLFFLMPAGAVLGFFPRDHNTPPGSGWGDCQ